MKLPSFKSFFLLFFTFLWFSIFFSLIVAPAITQAVQSEKPEIKVNIGSFSFLNFTPITFPESGEVEIPWIGEYVAAWYRYLVGIVGALAVVMIMAGGVLWMTAAGSPDKIGRAKEYISGALLGLVLALFSFVLLYTINPRLVRFEPIKVNMIANKPLNTNVSSGCCVCTFFSTVVVGATPETTCYNISNDECREKASSLRSEGRFPASTRIACSFSRGIACSDLPDCQ